MFYRTTAHTEAWLLLPPQATYHALRKKTPPSWILINSHSAPSAKKELLLLIFFWLIMRELAELAGIGASVRDYSNLSAHLHKHTEGGFFLRWGIFTRLMYEWIFFWPYDSTYYRAVISLLFSYTMFLTKQSEGNSLFFWPGFSLCPP